MSRNKNINNLIKVLAILTVLMVTLSSLPIRVLAEPQVMPDGTIFDPDYYAENNPDVVAVYGSNNPAGMYEHYVTFGKKEGRLPYAGAGSTETVNTTSVPANTSQSRTTSQDAASYFAKSVFIGDSVMVGYRNYLASHKESPVSSATFLAATSYSAAHALNVNDSLHPIYGGKKQPVWTSISQMNADRVFIMFGTNDLVVKDAFRASADVMALVDQIIATNPGIEINIISMTPVYAGVSKGALNNPTINAFNIMLFQGASQRAGVYYLDLNSKLLDANGDLAAQYCSDNYVHHNNTSYAQIWDPFFTAYATGN